MSALENPVYRFRGFELQPSERRLLGEGKPISEGQKARIAEIRAVRLD